MSIRPAVKPPANLPSPEARIAVFDALIACVGTHEVQAGRPCVHRAGFRRARPSILSYALRPQ